jgi:gamma-glutamyl-gamma-aminobutyrate hydrolase PuuD
MLLCVAFIFGAGPANAAIYTDAILYRIDANGVLDFNVTHSADVSGAQIVDNTGSGVVTLDSLKNIMGTPDAPARVFGTTLGARTLGKAVTATLETGTDNKVVKMIITGIRKRPVVGISWKSSSVGTDYVGFAEAFERNGAFAVFLPQITNAAGARTVLENIEGAFVTGGEDWHPGLYGEGVTPHGSSGWNIPRDISDINLMQQAIAMDVPMFMVCRGHQGFNIAMGGGLIQDVPYYLGEEVKAGRIPESRVTGSPAATATHRHYTYEDVVSNDTLLPYSGAGAATYTTVSCDVAGCRRVQVDGLIHSGGTSYHKVEATGVGGISTNSKWLYNIIGSTSMPAIATAHHQSVNPKKLGNGVTIVGYSSDGIVEAVEHQSSLFALAVQWHPERDALGNTSGVRNGYVNPDTCNPLLRALVKYAGVYLDKQGVLGIFKDAILPQNLAVTDKGFEYKELIVDKATILSNSMLDGWHISGVNPKHGTNWKAEVINGSAVVTVLFGELHNQSVKVTLTKDGASETQDINIAFSVEKSGILGGCNIGATILALLAFCAFVVRRKR